MNRYFKILFASILTVALVYGAAAKSTFSGERVKGACENYAYDVWGSLAEVEIAKNVRDVVFEEDGVKAKMTGNRRSLRGSCYIGVEFYKGERLLKRLELPARIKIYRQVPIATTRLNRGEKISSESIALAKREVTNYKEKELASPDYLIGMKLKRNVGKGESITNAMVKKETIINRGDKVMIVAQSGAIRICSAGEALQDAAIGQTIKVRRDGARAILEGSVAKDGSIIINLR